MISKSPRRNSFQKERYLERKAKEGCTPENDPNVKAMVEYFESWNEVETQHENDPTWRENNMEYDLRTTPWILEKVRSNQSYAQNLYAAMCNNSFQKLDLWPILNDRYWSCSWRYAGGIVAHMQQQGDYIDWYCSGIRDIDSPDNRYVSEGQITDEIREDFKRLGWTVVTDLDKNNY